jgi:UTP-glucose-1-phosphate uridylyltransferase
MSSADKVSVSKLKSQPESATGRNKRAIPDHFDKSYELEKELEAKNKLRVLDMVRNILPSH